MGLLKKILDPFLKARKKTIILIWRRRRRI